MLSYKLPYLAAWVLAAVSLAVIANTPAFAREMDGMLEPYEEVKVSSQVPGILDEVLVERGDIVKKGQVLARLKSGVEQAEVELAEAKVDFGKRKAKRNEELSEKHLISQHELDELNTEIQISELQLKQARENLELRIIRSTIDGVVVERFLSPGESVAEEPIMSIAGIDPLYAEVVAPIDSFGSVRVGMRAEVRPEQPVGGVYKGKVVIVDKVFDAASGTFGVRVEIPNPSLKLPAGLRCRVRFLAD